MCPLVMELKKYPTDFETLVCVTGQHREMLDQVLDIFEVRPDYDMNIVKHGQELDDVGGDIVVFQHIMNEVNKYRVGILGIAAAFQYYGVARAEA